MRGIGRALLRRSHKGSAHHHHHHGLVLKRSRAGATAAALLNSGSGGISSISSSMSSSSSSLNAYPAASHQLLSRCLSGAAAPKPAGARAEEGSSPKGTRAGVRPKGTCICVYVCILTLHGLI